MNLFGAWFLGDRDRAAVWVVQQMPLGQEMLESSKAQRAGFVREVREHRYFPREQTVTSPNRPFAHQVETLLPAPRQGARKTPSGNEAAHSRNLLAGKPLVLEINEEQMVGQMRGKKQMKQMKQMKQT